MAFMIAVKFFRVTTKAAGEKKILDLLLENDLLLYFLLDYLHIRFKWNMDNIYSLQINKRFQKV
jgi:hypothetical protein